MKVLERGSAPHAPLRLSPLVGSVQRIRVRSESQGAIKDAGQKTPLPPVPGVQMVLAAEVLSVSASGEVRFQFTLESAALLIQPGTPPQAVEKLHAQLEPLPGLTGEGRVGSDGRSQGFTLKLPKDMAAPVRDQLQQVTATLAGLGRLLPLEALGLGARWSPPLPGKGPLSGARTTLELKKREATGFGLRLELDSTSKPQPAPENLRTKKGGESLTTYVRGQGGCTFSLDRLWPTRFELDVETRLALRAEDKDSPRRMDSFATLQMRLRELSFSPPRTQAAATRASRR
ncbi:hypothetical protein HJC10_18970 [Corallococcus exiguus]|uniref:hypothetical protein n=1 Tax=Corallococcus TaxID=83461 RepID=UPI0011C43569|nr:MULTISPECIES: hypothetical protein [Corallococcus]NNB88731.1 hypothetical protein [Corallococcus exiguus]NNB96209.1 hypothetical protein [Corallococcus exiguus]NNC04927.1 hypothetical protein [Corallococcus exiguus]NPC48725.1 hypothetical protein [Corallococcus exiguus]